MMIWSFFCSLVALSVVVLFYNIRHHDHSVLFAGKGSPGQPAGQRNAVQYLSLYDNKILRKFRGHTDLVTNISMCPGEDMFLTSSRDRTVRYVVVCIVFYLELCLYNPLIFAPTSFSFLGCGVYNRLDV
jgi:hypothetical protein